MRLSLDDLLDGVESDSGKLILMYLAKVGNAPVDTIKRKLGLTLSKTLSVLSYLEEKGKVVPLEASVQDRYQLAKMKHN